MRKGAIVLVLFIAIEALAQPAAAGDGSPQIQSLVPASGSAGSPIDVTGRGFAEENTVYFGTVAVHHVHLAASAGIACTIASSCQPGIVQTLKLAVPGKLTRGSYIVKVRNARGTSNAVRFEVSR